MEIAYKFACKKKNEILETQQKRKAGMKKKKNL